MKKKPVDKTSFLLSKVAKKIPLNRIERLELHDYTCFHLFGPFYLVRNISRRVRRFSLYSIIKIDDLNC